MAELADAPDLGSGVYDVQVQVLSSASANKAVKPWKIRDFKGLRLYFIPFLKC